MSNKPNIRINKIEDILKQGKICRDFYFGTHEIKKKYLPKWHNESDDGYKIRVESTPIANMYAPIVSGISGLITKQAPNIQGFEKIEFEKIDGKELNLNAFIKKVCESSIVNGVEFVAVKTDVKNQKVFLESYKYENLISYFVQDNKLQQIVFKEKIEERKDLFGIKELERYIVFKIGGGEVWWKKDGELKKQEEWNNGLQVVPVASIQTGKQLSEFELVPRMHDIAELNRVLIQLDSRLVNVLNIIGNPIGKFFGDFETEKDASGNSIIQIGDRGALHFPDKTTHDFLYAEVDGKGVKLIVDKIEEIKKTIDALGFALLSSSSNRTVVDAKQNESKNTSFLTDVASELETKFNFILRWMIEIQSKKPKETDKIEFKKDFDDIIKLAESNKTIEKMRDRGDLSLSTYLERVNAINVGMLGKDFDAKEEAKKIQDEIVV